MTPRVQYDNDKDKSLDRSGVAYAAIFIAVKRLLLMMFGYLSLKFLLTTYPSPIRIVEHLPMWAALVIGLLWSDFINYWVHRSEHWSDFLWEFHKVHHASERMTVLAAARTHVFSFYVLVQGGHVAAAWLIGLPAEALLVIEVFDVVFAGVWAHANIDFPKHRMPWWGYVLATPNIHGTHHGLDSRCNYGQVFVLWDFLFGTYRPVDRAFIYGIGDSTYTNSNLWWQQVEPFIGAFNVLKRSVRRIGRPIASDVPQTRV
ncbi:MAG: sterol desaturase family protein [Myxococcaceae bacterium]